MTHLLLFALVMTTIVSWFVGWFRFYRRKDLDTDEAVYLTVATTTAAALVVVIAVGVWLATQ